MASVSILKRLTDRPFLWFRLGILAIFVVSIALRFWGLGRFNTLVFDEVYYANFAVGYLKGRPEFGGHPPLSNYIIAISIWLAQHTPLGNDPIKNDLTGMLLSPFSYRWMNALVGSLVPLVVAGLAYQLSHRRSYALIAGIFAAADGLFLVESRYALNNIYLVLFGLLGHWLLLLALDSDRLQRWFWLTLSGVAFGGSVAIKWNGVSFLIGAYLIWIAAWVIRLLHTRLLDTRSISSRAKQTPLQRLTQLNPGHFALFFALIPFVTYWLTWIPYLQLDPNISFWDWQTKILDYHNRVGGMDAHAYCSYWYTWIFMLRPVAYFYQTSHSVTNPPALVGPPLPQNTEVAIYDVHAMGNPILWWLSSAAIFLLIALMIDRLLAWTDSVRTASTSGGNDAEAEHLSSPQLDTWIGFYLVTNWVASLLLWVRVTRCTFLYHYMGASIFSLLAIALICDRWLQSPFPRRRTIALTLIFLILAAFVFWMPIYLGLPLSPQAIQLRRWFPSWI